MAGDATFFFTLIDNEKFLKSPTNYQQLGQAEVCTNTTENRINLMIRRLTLYFFLYLQQKKIGKSKIVTLQKSTG